MTKASPVVALQSPTLSIDHFPFTPRDAYQKELLALLYGDKKTLGIAPSGWNVLIAVFKRPGKTAGGILLTERTRDEDDYQGRVGLVIALGPDTYRDDRMRVYAGPWVQPGDWVVFPAFENTATKHRYRGITVAEVPDDRLTATVDDPMDVF